MNPFRTISEKSAPIVNLCTTLALVLSPVIVPAVATAVNFHIFSHLSPSFIPFAHEYRACKILAPCLPRLRFGHLMIWLHTTPRIFVKGIRMDVVCATLALLRYSHFNRPSLPPGTLYTAYRPRMTAANICTHHKGQHQLSATHLSPGLTCQSRHCIHRSTHPRILHPLPGQ